MGLLQDTDCSSRRPIPTLPPCHSVNITMNTCQGMTAARLGKGPQALPQVTCYYPSLCQDRAPSSHWSAYCLLVSSGL